MINYRGVEHADRIRRQVLAALIGLVFAIVIGLTFYVSFTTPAHPHVDALLRQQAQTQGNISF